MKCPECEHVFRSHQLYVVNKEGRGRYTRTCPSCLIVFDEGKKKKDESVGDLKKTIKDLQHRCALLDNVICCVAEAAGITETYCGVDVDPECSVLVERVKRMRKALENIKSWIPDNLQGSTARAALANEE